MTLMYILYGTYGFLGRGIFGIWRGKGSARKREIEKYGKEMEEGEAVGARRVLEVVWARD